MSYRASEATETRIHHVGRGDKRMNTDCPKDPKQQQGNRVRVRRTVACLMSKRHRGVLSGMTQGLIRVRYITTRTSMSVTDRPSNRANDLSSKRS